MSEGWYFMMFDILVHYGFREDVKQFDIKQLDFKPNFDRQTNFYGLDLISMCSPKSLYWKVSP